MKDTTRRTTLLRLVAPYPRRRRQSPSDSRRLSITAGDTHMLMTIALILIALWLLGVVTSYTMGGVIHVLLVIAVVIFLVRVIQGRRLV